MILKFPEFSRGLRRGEESKVDQILTGAYGHARAAERINALRKSGDIAGEVVLPFQGGVVGYYALAHMPAPAGWLCVAAAAIAPDWQGSGHGRRLMGVLSEWARLSGQNVVASGPARFWQRAGFAATGDVTLAGPAAAAQAEPLPDLRYPRAFQAFPCA